MSIDHMIIRGDTLRLGHTPRTGALHGRHGVWAAGHTGHVSSSRSQPNRQPRRPCVASPQRLLSRTMNPGVGSLHAHNATKASPVLSRYWRHPASTCGSPQGPPPLEISAPCTNARLPTCLSCHPSSSHTADHAAQHVAPHAHNPHRTARPCSGCKRTLPADETSQTFQTALQPVTGRPAAAALTSGCTSHGSCSSCFALAAMSRQ